MLTCSMKKTNVGCNHNQKCKKKNVSYSEINCIGYRKLSVSYIVIKWNVLTRNITQYWLSPISHALFTNYNGFIAVWVEFVILFSKTMNNNTSIMTGKSYDKNCLHIFQLWSTFLERSWSLSWTDAKCRIAKRVLRMGELLNSENRDSFVTRTSTVIWFTPSTNVMLRPEMTLPPHI